MPAQSTRAHNEVTCNTPFRLSVVAVMCVLVVSAFLLLAHRVSMLCELGFDYLYDGIVVGLFIYRYDLKRSEYSNDRWKSIRLMNPHVRNALNPITVAIYAHGHAEELNNIQSSSNRIDWALREILPGQVLDDCDDAAAEKRRGGIVWSVLPTPDDEVWF